MIAIPYYETSNFVFSNFSAHSVRYNGIVYPTAEHAYHAQKFDILKVQEQIKNCSSPLEAWTLAGQLKPYRRADWDEVKVAIMKEVLRAKVSQHSEVQAALIATGDEEIVEVNPEDDFWGNGPDGNGQNQTGKILMRIRDELTANI